MDLPEKSSAKENDMMCGSVTSRSENPERLQTRKAALATAGKECRSRMEGQNENQEDPVWIWCGLLDVRPSIDAGIGYGRHRGPVRGHEAGSGSAVPSSIDGHRPFHHDDYRRRIRLECMTRLTIKD